MRNDNQGRVEVIASNVFEAVTYCGERMSDRGERAKFYAYVATRALARSLDIDYSTPDRLDWFGSRYNAQVGCRVTNLADGDRALEQAVYFRFSQLISVRAFAEHRTSCEEMARALTAA